MNENNYDARRAYYARRKKRRRKIIIKRIFVMLLTVGILAGGVYGGVRLYGWLKAGGSPQAAPGGTLKYLTDIEIPEWIDQQIIHKHNTARTGAPLSEVKNIVIHYVGNPGTSAQNNRDYYDKSSTEVSSHFVVGLDGEIIQCVPLYEKSSASNWRNGDTISIETCHPDDTGKFNDATYNSLVKLTAWLLNKLKLDENDIIRHYDITGKLCPLYYVENEDKWEQLKKDVGSKINEYK